MAYVKIQDEELIYDRTRNFSGISDFQSVEEISCPTKGSSVEFRSKDKSITTNNNYLNIMPVGINNLYAKFNMVYEVDEQEARELANFLESKKGIEPVFFDSDPTVYKKINGFCNAYSINQLDPSSFSISSQFEITESPGSFNWTSMNFLQPDYESLYYEQENRLYYKHDVVYDQRLEFKYQDKINNFYYCVEDHDASLDTSINLEESPYWTRDFFWQPDVGQSNSVEFDIQRFGDKDGFPLRRKTKDNTASFPISYNYSKISTKQLKGMLHFLESQGGYRRFRQRIPAVYNRPKIFVCKRWVHTWDTFDSHNLEVFFDEDPLGIMPDRVIHNEETLSTRAFDGNSNLVDSVQGDIPDFWANMNSEIFNIKIGAACETIGSSAFAGNVNLRGDLIIPGNVKTIQSNAFDSCAMLDGSLLFGGGVNYIGEEAFKDCSQIVGDLQFPPNIKYIGNKALFGCSNLNGDLSLGKILTGIGTGALQGCNRLEGELKIPPTLKTVSTRAFRGCTRLYGDLEIPSGVENIEEEAFWNCRRLGTDIILPPTIKTIEDNAFYGCKYVYNVYINAPVAPSIFGDPFPSQGMEKLRKIHVPLSAVGYNAPYWLTKRNEGKLVYDITL
jgi:phage-related protein